RISLLDHADMAAADVVSGALHVPALQNRRGPPRTVTHPSDIWGSGSKGQYSHVLARTSGLLDRSGPVEQFPVQDGGAGAALTADNGLSRRDDDGAGDDGNADLLQQQRCCGGLSEQHGERPSRLGVIAT